MTNDKSILAKLENEFGGSSILVVNWHIRYGLDALAQENNISNEQAKNYLEKIRAGKTKDASK